MSPESVINEIYKDPIAKEKVDTFIAIGSLHIHNPTRKSIEKAVEYAKEKGERYRLSKADIDVLSLAIEFRKYNPIVITDDYSLQNLLEQLNIRYISLRRRIKKVVEKWEYRCVKCGAIYGKPQDECTICGGSIRREPIKRL